MDTKDRGAGGGDAGAGGAAGTGAAGRGAAERGAAGRGAGPRPQSRTVVVRKSRPAGPCTSNSITQSPGLWNFMPRTT